MTTLFLTCFIAGLALSALSFVSGFDEVTLLETLFGGGDKAARAVRSFNLAAITAFLMWFGGAGLLLDRLTTLSPLLVVGVAVLGGVAGGTLVNRVMTALVRSVATAEPLSMIGVIGHTTVGIREADGTGEIVFTHAGTRRVAGARSDSGRALPKGTEVVVTRYDKGIAYVAAIDEFGPAAKTDELKEV